MENMQDSRGHEADTLSGRTVAVWSGVFAAVIAVSLLLMAGLLELFESGRSGQGGERKREADPRRTVERGEAAPKFGRLERMRAEQQARLEEYRWVDREKRVARVPIERAMKMLVERERDDE